MTTQELNSKISFRFSGYGHFKVTIEYRGQEYTCTTTNTMAIDRINDDNDGRSYEGFYSTKKQALLSLWEECKRANHLY